MKVTNEDYSVTMQDEYRVTQKELFVAARYALRTWEFGTNLASIEARKNIEYIRDNPGEFCTHGETLVLPCGTSNVWGWIEETAIDMINNPAVFEA